MHINRYFAKVLSACARQFPCVALCGARQVGKTTLLREHFPNYKYLNLELPSVASQAETNSSEFFAEHSPPLIIDEVQAAPGIFKPLKNLIDQNRHAMGQYILTGSQKFPLMKNLSESLAGRVGIVELETLSLGEINNFLGVLPVWSKLLARGMYPELWRQKDSSSSLFFSSYIATYLERDVRQILNVGSLRDFERFLRACAARSAQLLNFSDLARDVGISVQTAKAWIAVLEASNQIFLLEPYFENVGKRLVKSPKLYIHDSGLLMFLLGLDATSMAQSPLAGAIWETFVYSELRKKCALDSLSDKPSQIWFYRDGQGNEIDFLIIHKGQINMIEAKWTESPDKRWAQSFIEAEKGLKRSKSYSLGKKTILCLSPAAYKQEDLRICSPLEFSL